MYVKSPDETVSFSFIWPIFSARNMHAWLQIPYHANSSPFQNEALKQNTRPSENMKMPKMNWHVQAKILRLGYLGHSKRLNVIMACSNVCFNNNRPTAQPCETQDGYF